METALRLLALCLVCLPLGALLRRFAPEWGLPLSLGALVVGAAMMSGEARTLLTLVRSLSERTGLDPALFSPLYKTVAIAVTVRWGTALCRDAGESALASLLETGGAVCALLCAAPLIQKLLELMEGWI